MVRCMEPNVTVKSKNLEELTTVNAAKRSALREESLCQGLIRGPRRWLWPLASEKSDVLLAKEHLNIG